MQNFSYENEFYLHENTVADSDLQIRGGGGHPDPEIRGPPPPPKKKKIPAVRTSVWSKNKGGGWAPRTPPLDPPLE